MPEQGYNEQWNKYVQDNPDWMIQTHMRLYYEALFTLSKYIQDSKEPEVTWDNPSISIRHPVNVNVGSDNELEIFWTTTNDESGIRESLRKLLLKELTRGILWKKQGKFFRDREEGLAPHIVPFEYGFSYTVRDNSGRERLAGGAVEFEFWPLAIDLDEKVAYFPVEVSLNFKHLPPTEWREQDRQRFLTELLEKFAVPSILTEIKEKEPVLLKVPSSQLYHNLLQAVASGIFNLQGNWPQVDLSSSNKKLTAEARLMPLKNSGPLVGEREQQAKELMKDKINDFDDLTADVLDIIAAKWIQNARHSEDPVNVSATEILDDRGLKRRPEGGYAESQRKEIKKQIDLLAHTRITVENMEVYTDAKRSPWEGESEVIVVETQDESSIEGYTWKLRPGRVFVQLLFDKGRQTALLSQKALMFHPYRQRWEKRLARYLAWLWRIDAKRTMGGVWVGTILDAVGQIDTRNPQRTKERLEKALNTLHAEGLITGWQYWDVDNNAVGKRGWVEKWRSCKVLIEPPQEILDHYEKIERPDKVNVGSDVDEAQLADRVKAIREKRGLTIKQAAGEIGIATGTLSQIENTGKIGQKTAPKVEKWLKAHEEK